MRVVAQFTQPLVSVSPFTPAIRVSTPSHFTNVKESEISAIHPPKQQNGDLHEDWETFSATARLEGILGKLDHRLPTQQIDSDAT